MSGIEEIIQIARRDQTLEPAALSRLATLLKTSGEEDFDFLLEEVDQSDYSLPDWVEALFAFDEWMQEQKVSSRPIRAMVGYIHCCTLTSAPTISLPSLKVIVSKSLTEYGFEAVSESQK